MTREPKIKTRIRIHPDGGWGVQRWEARGTVIDKEKFALRVKEHDEAMVKWREDPYRCALPPPYPFATTMPAPPDWHWTGFVFDTIEKARDWLRRYLRMEEIRKTLPATHPRSTRHEDHQMG